MKRVTPREAHTDAERYPSLLDRALPESAPPSRRAFLRGAAAVGAAAVGAALGGALHPGSGGEAQAAPAGRAPKRVILPVRSRYRFQHGNYELQQAAAQTHHADLARFLGDPKEAARVEQALRTILDRHHCGDLLDGKRLARLQGRIADALVALYRQRTRRIAPRPTVVLFVGVPGDRCKGDCAPPTPVCRPPKP